jgi:transcriptional regulator with XRE-family HTH domain
MVGGMPDLNAVVARNVRAERARHGWRQRELAERCGWSVDTVSNLETGQRRVGVADLPVLCRAFGVTIERLLVGADADDLQALGLA